MASQGLKVVQLQADDADRIADLERRCFIACLQATVGTIQRRFAYGHFMYGLDDGHELMGLICFSYGHFDPTDRASFPATLKELCCQPPVEEPNAVYLYNLEVDPRHRGLGHYRALLRIPLDQAKRDGLVYAVGNGRLPSYAGSDPTTGHERVRPNPVVRAAIDRYLAGGDAPTLEELLHDPLAAIYHRLMGGAALWVIPNFAPDDSASGGVRAIGFRELATWGTKPDVSDR